jgi:2OG-Fe(II) oxygenase superfamily
VIRNIEERIAKVTHLPVDHGEGMQVMSRTKALVQRCFSSNAHGWPDGSVDSRNCSQTITSPTTGVQNVFQHPPTLSSLQVLNYHHGQEYQPHHDFFHEGFPDRGSGQRIATVLMYL